MRETARLISIVGVALAPIACGGPSQTPPQNPTPIAVGSNPVDGVEAGPNLAPVAEPTDVVAVVRWKNPRRVLDTFKQWINLDISVENQIDKAMSVNGISSVVAMDAPVELLVALDPKASDSKPRPFISFSIGLRSVEDARQIIERDEDHEAREVHEGVYRVKIGPRHDRLNCYVAPSLGVSAARLVCGPRDRDVEELYPYMTRGLPVATLPDNDLHGQIRLAPIQARYGKMLPSALEMGASVLSHEIGTGDRNLDRAISDSVTGLSQEVLALSNDLNTMQFNVNLDATGKTMSGDLSLAFKSKSSWIAQRMFDHASNAGPPPPIFWNVPLKSDTTFYSRGVDSKHYTGIQRHGSNLLDAALARETFSAADRKAIVSLYERLIDGSPVSVSASGHLEPPSMPRSASEFEQIRSAISNSFGWQLIGLEESSARVEGWLRDFSNTYRRPSVQRWLRKKADVEARSMPTIRYGVHRAAGLPGLKAMTVSVPATMIDSNIKGPAQAIKFYIMILPSGSRTWVALGADKATLETQLKAVKTGGAAVIKARADLVELKKGRQLNGGYMTLAGLVAQAASGSMMDALNGESKSQNLKRFRDFLARMPNHGETPMLITSVLPSDSPSTVQFKFKVNQGTIRDLRSLIMLGASGRQP